MNDTNICVLVVDDEVPILKMLNLQFSRMGFTVDIATNGNDAINKIDHNFYNMILTDIKMSETSGDQILQYVKSKKGNTLPVVGMSGTPWLLENENFDAVLEKPFTIDEMAKVFDKILTVE